MDRASQTDVRSKSLLKHDEGLGRSESSAGSGSGWKGCQAVKRKKIIVRRSQKMTTGAVAFGVIHRLGNIPPEMGGAYKSLALPASIFVFVTY